MSTVAGGGLLLGVDLGTTACKCIVFDAGLGVVSSAVRAMPLLTLSGAEVEQDAESWWTAARDVVRECLAGPHVRADRIRGVGVCTQGISFAPVDESLRPLRNAINWLDTRAASQRQRVLATMGERTVFGITGKRCSEHYVLPKLMWMKEREPQLYGRTHAFLMPLDFLLARLTGEVATDHSMASGTMCYDVTGQTWSSRMLAAFGLDRDKLPALRWGSSSMGRMRRAAAAELGLPTGVAVAVGGQDQKAAVLGSGIGSGIGSGRVTVSLGTAMAVTRQTPRPIFDDRMRIPCFTDLVEGQWVVEGSAGCCSALDWLQRTFFPSLRHDGLDRLAAEGGGARRVFFYPHLSGSGSPDHHREAAGALCGLDLSTSAAQIVRSVYDGVAFVVRSNLEAIRDLTGSVEELRIFGGGSRSDVWSQIIADATGTPVSRPRLTECACAGAAILAGVACGVYGSPSDAIPLVGTDRVFVPRDAPAREYRDRYGEFLAVQERLFGDETETGDRREP